MKIYRCDRCGHEDCLPQIVGTEYEYKGFRTLVEAVRTDKVTDVCKSCFSAIEKARKEIFDNEQQTKWEKFKKVIGMI